MCEAVVGGEEDASFGEVEDIGVFIDFGEILGAGEKLVFGSMGGDGKLT